MTALEKYIASIALLKTTVVPEAEPFALSARIRASVSAGSSMAGVAI